MTKQAKEKEDKPTVLAYPEPAHKPPFWPLDGTQDGFLHMVWVAVGVIFAFSVWLVFIRTPRKFGVQALARTRWCCMPAKVAKAVAAMMSKKKP